MKKVSKKSETEKFSKIAYFLAFLAFLCFFGNAIYSLLFHRSMRAFFALKLVAFLALFSPLLPFFLSALLRYVRNCAAWRLSSVSTYPPPYTGGAEISLTQKKIFLFFFNIDICRNFFFFFLHFGTLLWWIDVCGVVLCL